MPIKAGDDQTYDWNKREFNEAANRAQGVIYEVMHALMGLQKADFPDRPGLHDEGAAVISGALGAVIRFAIEGVGDAALDQELRGQLISVIDQQFPHERELLNKALVELAIEGES